jgi:hypothetical protein
MAGLGCHGNNHYCVVFEYVLCMSKVYYVFVLPAASGNPLIGWTVGRIVAVFSGVCL